MLKKIVHENPWFKVTKEEFKRHDGLDCTFYIVNKNPAVFIIPIENNKEIYLVKQYRPATKTWGWELPAGSTDGEDPLIAAQRELQEETGLIANYWRKAGELHLAPGLTDNNTYIFIARSLVKTTDNKQYEDGIVDCKKFTLKEIFYMVSNDEIHDGPTIAVLAKVLWMDGIFRIEL